VIVNAEDLADVLSFRKEKSKEANKLADYGLWEDAESTNLLIIEKMSGDSNAYMRLGDALSKQGRGSEANEIYQYGSNLDKMKLDRTKRAITCASEGDWKSAAEFNQMILDDFPWDLEAYNRLGKAYLELQDAEKAIEAFRCSLVISPNGSIAKKNLARSEKLKASGSNGMQNSSDISRTFIEETGKTGVTDLVDLSDNLEMSSLIVGHSVNLVSEGKGLKVYAGEQGEIGRVEARIGSRLNKLIEGGNTYEANITKVSDSSVTLIIRETYRDPSQAKEASFSAVNRGVINNFERTYDFELNDGGKFNDLKDWSNDDTESGDEEAFNPMIPRIISGDESLDDDKY